jgi:pyruvate kinase
MVAAMFRRRRAKIVATLGPATATEEGIARLAEAGADVFRLNFSHGSHAEHGERFRAIVSVRERLRRSIGIIADLQGPKLRVGRIAGGRVRLDKGGDFRLDLSEEPGDGRRAPLPHPEIFAALKPGAGLLLDDGRIRLTVTDCGPTSAETRIEVGGWLTDHKGVNVPGVLLEMSALTDKDRADLEFALGLGVPWVALSFVQRVEDLAEAKALLGGRASLMAKLEKPSAIDQLFEIIDAADGVMVARGDLGVEMAAEDVPVLQKRIVRACRYAGRPVVVATQMLESMVSAPTPTRAEASDVATAVYEGADAVMLSAETAVGAFPAEAVMMMDRILRRAERDPTYAEIIAATRSLPEHTSADAITAAARQVAETIGAKAIVTFTCTGSTTLRAARERPAVPILALTPVAATAERLTAVWGVAAVRVDSFGTFDAMIEAAARLAVSAGIAGPGDLLAVTAGWPLGTPGATNVLRIVDIGRQAEG